MRLVTFNVNGLRSIKEYYGVAKKWSFEQFLNSFEADIICFQETKINEPSKVDHDMACPNGYHGYFAFHRTPRKGAGYSGVVTYCRDGRWTPVEYDEGFTGLFGTGGQAPKRLLAEFSEADLRLLDSEARCIVTDHGSFVLLNVYFPNDSGPHREDFRTKFYRAAELRCLDLLESGRSILLVGDINTTCHPIDHCDFVKPYLDLSVDQRQAVDSQLLDNLTASVNEPLMVPEFVRFYFADRPLRSWCFKLLHNQSSEKRFSDCFRFFQGLQPYKYTCWNTKIAARGTNYGTRLDYIIAAGPFFQEDLCGSGHSRLGPIVNCDHLASFMGSDHCPVFVALEEKFLPCVVSSAPAKTTLPRSASRQRKLDQFFAVKAAPASGIAKADEACDASSAHGPLTGQIDEGETSTRDSHSIEGKAANWAGVFGMPPQAPLCKGHNEPCKLWTVTKKGPNKGRKFYICCRPSGHVGDPAGSCNYFEWLHEPKGKKPRTA